MNIEMNWFFLMATPDSPVFELLDKLLRLVAHAFHSPGSILVLETLIRLKRDELPFVLLTFFN